MQGTIDAAGAGPTGIGTSSGSDGQRPAMQAVTIAPYAAVHRDSVVAALAAVRADAGTYPPTYVSDDPGSLAGWLERYPAAVRFRRCCASQLV
jgi:hypothetical protein